MHKNVALVEGRKKKRRPVIISEIVVFGLQQNIEKNKKKSIFFFVSAEKYDLPSIHREPRDAIKKQ